MTWHVKDEFRKGGAMGRAYRIFEKERCAMSEEKNTPVDQPETFTPGITKGMVREHAFKLYRDKLPEHPITLEDWVLAEKDLVQQMQTEQS